MKPKPKAKKRKPSKPNEKLKDKDFEFIDASMKFCAEIRIAIIEDFNVSSKYMPVVDFHLRKLFYALQADHLYRGDICTG